MKQYKDKQEFFEQCVMLKQREITFPWYMLKEILLSLILC